MPLQNVKPEKKIAGCICRTHADFTLRRTTQTASGRIAPTANPTNVIVYCFPGPHIRGAAKVPQKIEAVKKTRGPTQMKRIGATCGSGSHTLGRSSYSISVSKQKAVLNQNRFGNKPYLKLQYQDCNNSCHHSPNNLNSEGVPWSKLGKNICQSILVK